jgi:hypothetical protein
MKQFVVKVCAYEHECAGAATLKKTGDGSLAQKSTLKAVMNCINAHKWCNLLCAHEEIFEERPVYDFRFQLSTNEVLSKTFDALTDFNRLVDGVRQREQWRPDIHERQVQRMKEDWERCLNRLGLPDDHMLYQLFTSIMEGLWDVASWKIRADQEVKSFASRIWAIQSVIWVYMERILAWVSGASQ